VIDYLADGGHHPRQTGCRNSPHHPGLRGMAREAETCPVMPSPAQPRRRSRTKQAAECSAILRESGLDRNRTADLVLMILRGRVTYKPETGRSRHHRSDRHQANRNGPCRHREIAVRAPVSPASATWRRLKPGGTPARTISLGSFCISNDFGCFQGGGGVSKLLWRRRFWGYQSYAICKQIDTERSTPNSDSFPLGDHSFVFSTGLVFFRSYFSPYFPVAGGSWVWLYAPQPETIPAPTPSRDIAAPERHPR